MAERRVSMDATGKYSGKELPPESPFANPDSGNQVPPPNEPQPPQTRSIFENLSVPPQIFQTPNVFGNLPGSPNQPRPIQTGSVFARPPAPSGQPQTFQLGSTPFDFHSPIASTPIFGQPIPPSFVTPPPPGEGEAQREIKYLRALLEGEKSRTARYIEEKKQAWKEWEEMEQERDRLRDKLDNRPAPPAKQQPPGPPPTVFQFGSSPTIDYDPNELSRLRGQLEGARYKTARLEAEIKNAGIRHDDHTWKAKFTDSEVKRTWVADKYNDAMNEVHEEKSLRESTQRLLEDVAAENTRLRSCVGNPDRVLELQKDYDDLAKSNEEYERLDTERDELMEVVKEENKALRERIEQFEDANVDAIMDFSQLASRDREIESYKKQAEKLVTDHLKAIQAKDEAIAEVTAEHESFKRQAEKFIEGYHTTIKNKDEQIAKTQAESKKSSDKLGKFQTKTRDYIDRTKRTAQAQVHEITQLKRTAQAQAQEITQLKADAGKHASERYDSLKKEADEAIQAKDQEIGQLATANKSASDRFDALKKEADEVLQVKDQEIAQLATANRSASDRFDALKKEADEVFQAKDQEIGQLITANHNARAEYVALKEKADEAIQAKDQEIATATQSAKAERDALKKKADEAIKAKDQEIVTAKQSAKAERDALKKTAQATTQKGNATIEEQQRTIEAQELVIHNQKQELSNIGATRTEHQTQKENELAALRAEHTETLRRYTMCRDSLVKDEAKIEDLQKQLSGIGAAIEEHRVRAQAKDDEIAKLKSQIAETSNPNAEGQQSIRECDTKIEELQAENNDCYEIIDKFRIRLEEMDKEVAELSVQRAKGSSQHTPHSTTSTDGEEALRERDAKIEEQLKKLTAMEIALGESRAQKQAQDDEIAKLKDRERETSDRNASANEIGGTEAARKPEETVKDLEKKLAEAEAELKESRAQEQAAESALAEFQAEYTKLFDEYTTLKAEGQEDKRKIGLLNRKLSDHGAEFEEYRGKYDVHSQKMAELMREVREAKGKVIASAKTEKQLEKDLEAREQTISNGRKDVTELKNKVQKLEAQVKLQEAEKAEARQYLGDMQMGSEDSLVTQIQILSTFYKKQHADQQVAFDQQRAQDAEAADRSFALLDEAKAGLEADVYQLQAWIDDMRQRKADDEEEAKVRKNEDTTEDEVSATADHASSNESGSPLFRPQPPSEWATSSKSQEKRAMTTTTGTQTQPETQPESKPDKEQEKEPGTAEGGSNSMPADKPIPVCLRLLYYLLALLVLLAFLFALGYGETDRREQAMWLKANDYTRWSGSGFSVWGRRDPGPSLPAWVCKEVSARRY
ncbi:MAG: hypothetical protein L6R39_005972 [Caloplaca ligustica]|nr:MAG: hypothetical protein L6R39_005972 [Caloplaca ligustica]